MDPALLQAAQQYGLPGLMLLAFGWWIWRQDKKLDRREREHDRAQVELEKQHAAALELKRRDFLAELDKIAEAQREERRLALDAFLGALAAEREAINRMALAINGLADRVARLEARP